MTGKGAENAKDLLSELIVEAVRAGRRRRGRRHGQHQSREGRRRLRRELRTRRRRHRRQGARLRQHAVLRRGRRRRNRQRRPEIKETEIDAEVNVTDPDQLEQFLEQEEAQAARWPRKSLMSVPMSSSSTAASTTWPSTTLAQEGIIAVRRVKSSDQAQFASRDRRNAGLERRRPDRGRPRCRR